MTDELHVLVMSTVFESQNIDWYIYFLVIYAASGMSRVSVNSPLLDTGMVIELRVTFVVSYASSCELFCCPFRF